MAAPLALACGSLGTMAILSTVEPPATEGPPESALRARRAHESLPLIVPLLWICAVTLPVAGSVAALGGGVLWAWFRKQYVEERVPGFGRALNVTHALMAVAMVGVVYQIAMALE